MKKVYKDLSVYTAEIETLPYIWQFNNLESAVTDLTALKNQLPSWLQKKVADFESAVVAFKEIDETNSKEFEPIIYKALEGYDTESTLNGVRISVKLSLTDNTDIAVRLYYVSVPYYVTETKYDTLSASIADIRYHGTKDPVKVKRHYREWVWIAEDKRYYDSIYKESSEKEILKLLARAIVLNNLKENK